MKKILIIRFSSIGDIVLTTPVIRAIRKQLDAEVHFLTKEAFAPVLSANPYIHRLHLIKKDVGEVSARLRRERFDFIVDLHHNLRSAQVKAAVRRPSASFRKLNIEKWMLVNMGINRLPDVHIVDRYFDTVSALGVKNDLQGLDYFIPASDEVALSSLPQGFAEGYTGFVIGAKFMTKQLPAEKIASVIGRLEGPVIMLGGSEDKAKGETVTALLRPGQAQRVYNACGKYNLNQSASLVRQAQRIITHDTGLMHIAAAFKKDITSVWGNTVPAFGMYPYLPGRGSKIIEVKGLSCRPCSKLGHAQCPKGHFRCMMEINEAEIARS
ncbi:MAG: glycosyltransferase family 9 protein [Bacteroidota bacterium]